MRFAILLLLFCTSLAQAGVGYPSQENAAAQMLPVAAAAELPKVPDGLPGVTQLGGGSEDELLPADQAFRLNISVQDGRTLVADFVPAPGYYLYRDKIAFTLQGAPGIGIERVTLPKGDVKEDPTFGKTEVYHKPVQAVISLKREALGEQKKVKLNASYQGCNEPIGVCYPPIHKSFDLVLPAALAVGEAAAPAAAGSGAGSLSDSDQVAGLFKSGSFWLIVASFLGFGLLLSFTPCMFPMIPILSGIIAGQGQHLTKLKGLILSAAYVLGMAITYAIAGVAAGLSGTLLSAALQNPWVLGGFSLIFVLLALSMFGFYELQLPSALQSRLAEASNRLGGGHYAGVFIMGVLSAVIVGPCVAAPLAGALLYIGQTRDVVLGGTALFAMALGMGLPLLLVGTSAGMLLPKAGPWMESVKRFFGVLLLGVAIWLVSPVIPAVVQMLAWAALLIVSAIYLHALDPLPPGASGFRKFWKGVGVIALLVGVAMLVGALSGGRDVLQPLSGLRAVGTAGAPEAGASALKFQKVKSLAEWEEKLKEASGRYVMLDFYADWCISCKELERFTFSDPRVQERLKDVALVQADVTADTPESKTLLKRFKLFGPPGILFFDRQGREIPGIRVVGYQDSDRFLATLDAAFR